MKSKDFVSILKKIATETKTHYINGCFGAPMNDKNKKRYSTNNAYNRAHASEILALSADTFGFDCVGLIKGVLWGFDFDKNSVYGGADYCVNGVPDINEYSMALSCPDLTSDFKMELDPGEIVWIDGHIGVYVGDDFVVECTPSWKNQVQITVLGNNGASKSGYQTRNWSKHGHIPYVDYTDISKPETKTIDYTVKPGDSLWRISQMFGVSVAEIAKLNNIKNTNLIFVGQVLIIKQIETSDKPEFVIGDKVKMSSDATVYGKDTTFAGWVYNATLYVREINDDRIVISTQKTGAITGSVDRKYLVKI